MKVIDLTHVLGNNTPSYPGDPITTLNLIKTLEKDCYNLNTIYSTLHTGTHIDMPSHLTKDGRLVSDFEPESFLGRGVLLDVRNQSKIRMESIYEKRINKGDIVLLYTGFDEWFDRPDIYFGRHPSVDETLADFLVETRVKMLGIDMPSPDHPPYTVHKQLLSTGIFVLENLTGLSKLVGESSFEVWAIPLKIEAEASFVRAVARIQ